MKRRCNQCWRLLEHPRDFVSRRTGKVLRANCGECSGGRTVPKRRGLDPNGPLRVRVVRFSKNHKHYGIPTTISAASTCPPSCSMYGNGCYAEYHLIKHHWVQTAERGVDWQDFITWVARLPSGQLWRHNDAGDLPGKGDRLDIRRLRQLAVANMEAGARGFTFTHKPLTRPKEASAVAIANLLGFTVNLSADSLEEADRLLRKKCGPVAVVLPHDSPRRGVRTPRGVPVAVCPNQTQGKTCSECQLCARPNRTGVVGFLAHGQSKARVSELVQLRR